MRNLSFLLSLVAMLLLLPGRLIATELPQDDKLITGQLDNGLRYMIYPHSQPKNQVNLWLQIHTGSLQEEDNERGVAHFVEHMMFNGTKIWPGNKVIETFESMGLRFGRDVNAYTSYDETVYQVSLPTTQKQNLQKVMAIFSEWSNAATFEKHEVDAERGVITEEWRAHQDAKWRTSQARRPFLLANTRNLDREPIGLMDTVATVTPEQLRHFYQRWYQPNNMTFIVVGDIDSKEALALIKDNLGKLSANTAVKNRVWPTKAENHLRFNIINDKENRVNGIALYYRLPMIPVTDEQSFVEQAEWSMLIQLFNQRLQERIQSGELKTISGGTARSVKIAPDYQSIFFRVNARDDNMQDAANALMAELATIDQHGFSAAELDDVKATRLTWLKNAAEQQAERDLRMLTSRLASSSLNNVPFLSPEETYQLSKRLWQQITVQSLAEKWQQLRKNQDAFWEQMVNNDIAAKKALSPAAIQALEKEYTAKELAAYTFPGRNLSLTVHADLKAKITSQQKLAENLTSLTLSNGARVILAKSASEEEKLQLIAVSNKGDLNFPAEQKSLIALANKAVGGSGVGEISSSSLKRWSAENSVTMSSKVSGLNTLLSVSARANNPEPGFQLINQRITQSTINENIWASLQNAQIQALKTLDQHPAEKFAQKMYETRYNDPRTKLLQAKQIAQFTAADALAADRQLFSSPEEMTFVIVGNVAENKILPLITHYLGSIKPSKSTLVAGKPLNRATDNATVTVKEQNEPVAQVSQWKRYDSRTSINLATRMALDAFNVALAKDLRINIREQASGAYSVSSRLSVDPLAKDISHLLAFTCQPERYDELLTLANEVMAKRLAKGINQQELNEYQQNVQRSLDIQQRSVQQLANTIVNSIIQYDDPAAWIAQEKLLQHMTVENVNTAVKQYLTYPVNTHIGVLLPK
ncbi:MULTISPECIES: M16 family metallopeptidase [unclassified Escherichia]|uniref:M16 family metallopeptidase n=1 Tax=unclassified Escherichia TaxID=2608889 RepID=UPI00102A70B6|nr:MULTISPECIES: M16 family metallopeptidase [unclassified Escherichia]RZM88274.1 insulinase family protein [Escherichia sp. E1V33]TBR70476.1 insulinase family protein [Escherichia sp. E1S7]